MADLIDMEGKTFGVLTVLSRDGKHLNKEAMWLCRCVCGKTYRLRGSHIRRPIKNCFHDPQWNTPEHKTWEHMIERCERKAHDKYPLYGGRGISVCEKWRASFAEFLRDMGRKPTPKHTIDRIDNFGNYEPGNCRWATSAEQNRNRRNNVYVEHEGKRVLLVDLVEGLGLTRSIVYGRLKLGWSLSDALTVPVRNYKKKVRVS